MPVVVEMAEVVKPAAPVQAREVNRRKKTSTSLNSNSGKSRSDLLNSNSLNSRSGGLTYAEASNFKPALQMSDSRFGQHLRHSILGNHHLAHLENQLEADIEHMENALPEHKKTYAVGTVLFVIAIIIACQLIAIFCFDESGQTEIGTVVLRTGPPCQPGQYTGCRNNYPPHRLSPSSWMTDTGFLRTSTIILWITCVVSGLGLEVVVGEPMVAALSGETQVIVWHAAQLMFSLFISVAIFADRRAFRIGKFSWPAIQAYMNGIGVTLHHAASAYLIVAVNTHLFPLDRRVLACSLPLVMQHLVVLVKYWDLATYAICELSMEVLFEWEAFSNIREFSVGNGYDMSTRGIVLTMLTAHWFYWGAALCKIPILLHALAVDKGWVKDDPEYFDDILEIGGGLADQFRKTVADNDGFITYTQLVALIREKKLPLSDKQIQSLWDISDVDQSGTLTSEEMEKLLMQLAVVVETIEEDQKLKDAIAPNASTGQAHSEWSIHKEHVKVKKKEEPVPKLHEDAVFEGVNHPKKMSVAPSASGAEASVSQRPSGAEMSLRPDTNMRNLGSISVVPPSGGNIPTAPGPDGKPMMMHPSEYYMYYHAVLAQQQGISTSAALNTTTSSLSHATSNVAAPSLPRLSEAVREHSDSPSEQSSV